MTAKKRHSTFPCLKSLRGSGPSPWDIFQEKHLDATMLHLHHQDNYDHSNKIQCSDELAALNCVQNVISVPVLHNMMLGSPCNWNKNILSPHWVLEQHKCHKDSFNSFSAEHSNSSGKVHLSFERASRLLSAVLLVCEWNGNAKLNLRIAALVS